MSIITVYTKDASKLLSVLDSIASNKGSIKVLASDPSRLYNDSKHDDVSMASVTFSTDEDHSSVVEFINRDDVFVCEEDPSDW